MKRILLEPAMDWTNQQLHQRLKLAADALYLHGYLTKPEFHGIDNALSKDIAEARNAKARQ